jgi:hypothetical protein
MESEQRIDEFIILQCLPDGSVRCRGDATSVIAARRRLRERSGAKDEFFAMQLHTGAVIFRTEASALGKRIFQVAYAESIGRERAQRMRRLGYGVLSVLGSEAAKKLLRMASIRPEDIDIFMIGHAAPNRERMGMAEWIRTRYPLAKLLAINPPHQQILRADYNVLQGHPEIWLPLLDSHAAASGIQHFPA